MAIKDVGTAEKGKEKKSILIRSLVEIFVYFVLIVAVLLTVALTWEFNPPYGSVTILGTHYLPEDTTQIIVENSGLGGSIPSEIGLLTELTELDISNNTMNASIPSEIGLLTNLLTMDLQDNSFHGSIPSEIEALMALTALKLNCNEQLNGTIPSSLCLVPNATAPTIDCCNITCDCCDIISECP